MKAKDPKAVLAHCQKIAEELRQRTFMGRAIEVEIDDRDIRGGDKVWGWIKKGIPVRVEVGERDMEAGTVFVARRDRGHKDKASLPRDEFIAGLPEVLSEIQAGLLAKAKAFRDEHTKVIDDEESFRAFFTHPPTKRGRPRRFMADLPSPIGTVRKKWNNASTMSWASRSVVSLWKIWETDRGPVPSVANPAHSVWCGPRATEPVGVGWHRLARRCQGFFGLLFDLVPTPLGNIVGIEDRLHKAHRVGSGFQK